MAQVTAPAQIPSLAWEFPYATGAAEKKKGGKIKKGGPHVGQPIAGLCRARIKGSSSGGNFRMKTLLSPLIGCVSVGTLVHFSELRLLGYKLGIIIETSHRIVVRRKWDESNSCVIINNARNIKMCLIYVCCY